MKDGNEEQRGPEGGLFMHHRNGNGTIYEWTKSRTQVASKNLIKWCKRTLSWENLKVPNEKGYWIWKSLR